MKAKKIAYGLIGILIGLIIYISYLTNIPPAPLAKVNLEDFNIEEKGTNQGLKENTSLPKFQSYYITADDMTRYKESGLVSYGRKNPMFYWIYTPEPVEESQAKEGTQLSKATDVEDELQAEGVEEYDSKGGEEVKLLPKKVLGFDVNTGELIPLDAENIARFVYANGILPVDKSLYKVSSKFGPRLDPIEKINTFHVGLDISSKGIDGKEIVSMLPGVVSEKATREEGYGNFVVINHGEFSTVYAHLNKFAPDLKVGDNVLAGSVIGYIGSTGRSTGPHLHLEFKVGSTRLDPEIFINLILKRRSV